MATVADDNAFITEFFKGYPTEDKALQNVRQLVLLCLRPRLISIAGCRFCRYRC